MAFCRWSAESDVYCYRGCDLKYYVHVGTDKRRDVVLENTTEVIEYLLALEVKGVKVPQETYGALLEEEDD